MKLADREFIIDESRCFGCAACITLCPTHALTLDNLLVFVIDKFSLFSLLPGFSIGVH